MTHRPCGACRKLIPVDSGCPHWKPRRPVVRKNSGPPGSGLSKRQLEFRARDEAKVRVARFVQEAGRNYR